MALENQLNFNSELPVFSFKPYATLLWLSRYQAPANSVAPPSVYKPHTTHNSSIRSDEGLTLETSAFESLYGG